MKPSESDHTASTAAGKRHSELTVPAILLGLALSVVMGAANVYLGLRAGMTVSASIPAAVIGVGLLRGLLRRRSALESNLVQTAASAGESLAAGIIFTMPALILVGVWESFDFWTTSLIALAGGLLGVLLMIPMRRVFVVDNKELKYPEGVACAEVLRAGAAGDDEEGGDATSDVLLVAAGCGIGAVFKFAEKFLGLIRSSAEWATTAGSRVFFFGAEISPALLAVGYIVGLGIAVQIFIGGAIGWLITIPLLGLEGVESGPPVDMAYGLWSSKVRYIGVGAMVVGGVASIWKVRAGLRDAAREMMAMFRMAEQQQTGEESDRNLSASSILALATVCVLLIGGIYYVLLDKSPGLTVLTMAVMLVMSFFFAAVASYIVGLVGNSNSPVSGMTITAVLGTGALVWLFGFGGTAGIVATLGVAGVVCCVACTAGDVCNDLKTGHLLGASPRNQQFMQVLGVVVAAFIMAPVMTVLHQGSLNEGTGGIGGRDLPAPQAGLFAALADGFFGEGELPYAMVAIGAAIGVALLLADFFLLLAGSRFRLHVMPVAVGIYLPFRLVIPILLGGALSTMLQRRGGKQAEERQKRGVLVASGLIAGESLVGVVLGFIAFVGIKSFELLPWILERIAPGGWIEAHAPSILSLAALLLVAAWVCAVSRKTR